MRASAALLCILIASTAGAWAAPKLVYRVDQATAVIDGRHLHVTAKGAVRSGGWRNPRLIVRKGSASEAPSLRIDFVATPPGNDSAVVRTLVPIKVDLKMRLPRRDVAAVQVVSESNTVTAEIIPKRSKQRTAGN